MTVGELKKELEKFDDEMEVISDFDADYGWHNVERLTFEKDGELEFCNIKAEGF